MSDKHFMLAKSALGLVVAYDDLLRQHTGPISEITEAENQAIDEAYDRMVLAARTTLELTPDAASQAPKTPVIDDVRARLHLIRCFAEETHERNYFDKKFYIIQQVDRIVSALEQQEHVINPKPHPETDLLAAVKAAGGGKQDDH